MRRLSPFLLWVHPRFYPIADERSRIERLELCKNMHDLLAVSVWVCSRRRVLRRACSAAPYSDAWCVQSLHDGASHDESCDSSTAPIQTG